MSGPKPLPGEILLWMSLNKTLPQWRPFFEQGYIQDILKNIEKHISKDDVCPHVKDIFKVFKYVSPNDIRVVILGMDPYQSRGTRGDDKGKNRANGIAFSSNLNEIPRSLSNIYRELMENGYRTPPSADLTYLLRKGVFLVNSALTVQYDKSGSHSKLWEGFTQELLMWIVSTCRKNNNECCFLLWGRDAQNLAKKAKIYEKSKYVFVSSHPSPFSAYRGFIGCRHFTLVNEYLKSVDRQEIDWNWNPPSS